MDECYLSFKFAAAPRKHLLIGLIAGRTGRREGSQAHYFSAAHPQESNATADPQSWQPQFVLYAHNKWHSDASCEIDLVKAQKMV